MNGYMPIVLALAILVIVVPQILLLIFVCCKFSRTCQNCYLRLLVSVLVITRFQKIIFCPSNNRVEQCIEERMQMTT